MALTDQGMFDLSGKVAIVTGGARGITPLCLAARWGLCPGDRDNRAISGRAAHFCPLLCGSAVAPENHPAIEILSLFNPLGPYGLRLYKSMCSRAQASPRSSVHLS